MSGLRPTLCGTLTPPSWTEAVAASPCKPAGTVLPAHRTKGQKSNKKKIAVLAAVYTTESRVRTAEEVTESLFRDRQALAIVRIDKAGRSGSSPKTSACGQA